MKKVLHVNDSLQAGGAEQVFKDTMTIMKGITENYSYVSDNKRNIFSYIFSFKNFIKLLVKLYRIKPDIVHLHNFYHYLSPAILLSIFFYKSFYKLQVIYTAHDYHLICPNSGMQYYKNNERINFSNLKKEKFWFHQLDDRGWIISIMKKLQFFIAYRVLFLHKVIDTIIAPSFFMKNILSVYGIKNKIKVIRNPCSLPVEKESRVSIPCLDSLNLIFIGRLSKEKGIIELIRDLERVDFPITLHVLGDGDLLEHVQDLAKKSSHTIVMHGYKDKSYIYELSRKCHAFILPSIWYENAPLSIIEAAFWGLPIVVRNLGGMKEMAELTEISYTYNTFEELNYIITVHLRHNLLINRVRDSIVFSKDFYRAQIKSLYDEY